MHARNVPEAALGQKRQPLRRILRPIGKRYERILWGFLSASLALISWQIAANVGLVDLFIASSPTRTAGAVVKQFQAGTLTRDVMSTMSSFAWGFGIALAIGVPAGFLSGWYRTVEYAIEPFVSFFDSMPKQALYPLLIIWVGLGTPTVIALGAILGVVPIYISAFSGIKGVKPELTRAATSFGASPRVLFWKVAIPSSMPVLVAGGKIGVDRVLTGVVIGELFGGHGYGLAFRMEWLSLQLRTDEFFAPLVVLVTLAFLFSESLAYLERRTSRWRAQDA